MKAAEDWIPTRQSLLSRLRDWDDAASWQDFFDTYSKLLYHVARKSGLNDAEAQEAVQETVITVARQMPKFRYDRSKGSFKGWLLRTTQWRIGDQFRKRRSHLPLDVVAGGAARHGMPPSDVIEPAVAHIESDWDRLWERQMLEVAIGRVRQRSDPREFLMFDLVTRQDWAPAKVAEKLHVSRARVYYVRQKITRLIRKEVERLDSDLGGQVGG